MDLRRWQQQAWVAALIVMESARASSPGFTEAGIQKLCNVASDLTRITGVAQTKLLEQKSELAAALTAQSALAAAAIASGDANRGAVYAAATEAAANCASKATQQAEALSTKALSACRAAVGASGRITAVVELLLAATNQNNNAGKCIVQANTGTKTTLATLEQLGCPTTSAKDSAAARIEQLTTVKATGFAAFAAEAPITGSGSSNNVCAFLTGNSNNADHIWDHAGGSDRSATIAHGILKLAFDNTATAAAAKTLKLDNLGEWGQGGETENHKLFKAIGSLVNEPVHACGGTAAGAIKTFLNPKTLQEFLAPAYKKTVEKTAEKQAEEAINKAANKAQATADDLKALLDDLEIPTLKAGEITTKTLKQLNYNVANSASILGSLLQLKAKSETSTICPKLSPEESGKSPTETEEKCKDKPQAECKDENGCMFKDGKCKLKDGVKAENGEKNTNTTGSNSFVIKASPLLLAFLLS